MRLLVVLLLCLGFAACGEDASGGGGDDSTRLAIDIEGVGEHTMYMAVRCGKTRPCESTRGLQRVLASARDTRRACTEQFGGPERAHVHGALAGRPVDVTIARTNGCGIADYADLFAVLGRPEPLAPAS